MSKFDAKTLSDLHDAHEVAIRTEKHPDAAVVIWVAVADGEAFVRSSRGAKGRWYRDLAAGGPATLELGGRRLAVQAVPANDAAAIARASREYLRKYASSSLRRFGYGCNEHPQNKVSSVIDFGREMIKVGKFMIDLLQ